MTRTHVYDNDIFFTDSSSSAGRAGIEITQYDNCLVDGNRITVDSSVRADGNLSGIIEDTCTNVMYGPNVIKNLQPGKEYVLSTPDSARYVDVTDKAHFQINGDATFDNSVYVGGGLTVDSSVYVGGGLTVESMTFSQIYQVMQKNIQGLDQTHINTNNGTDWGWNRAWKAGSCGMSTGYATLSTDMTKDMSSTWSVGDTGGIRASTLVPTTGWYPVFALGKSTDPTVMDIGIDQSPDATQLLIDASGDGFNTYRRIGYCYYYKGITPLGDGWVPLLQSGDNFWVQDAGFFRSLSSVSAYVMDSTSLLQGADLEEQPYRQLAPSVVPPITGPVSLACRLPADASTIVYIGDAQSIPRYKVDKSSSDDQRDQIIVNVRDGSFTVGVNANTYAGVDFIAAVRSWTDTRGK